MTAFEIIMEKFSHLRRCVGCFRERPAPEMIRIVKTAKGKMRVELPREATVSEKTEVSSVDKKLLGRSAYLCPDPVCIQKSLKVVRKKAPLPYALKMPLSPQIQDQLRAWTPN